MGALGSCASGPRSRELAPVPEVGDSMIDATLILIGDAGGAQSGDAVLRAASQRAKRNPERTVVAFLGDLIYEVGMPRVGAPNRSSAEEAVRAQLEVVARSGSRGFVVPGNHDWGGGRADGLHRIMRLQSFIDEADVPGVVYAPRNGCPGPAYLDVGEHLRVIGIDTHWWLADVEQLVSEEICPLRDLSFVQDSIRSLFRSAGEREVVVTAHHPLDSYGPHGGYFTLKQHVFPLTKIADWLWVPLPIVGSVYPLLRRSGVAEQDLSSSRYRLLIEGMEQTLREFQPLAYAGGHEHSLQVLSGEIVRYNIVSGAGFDDHTQPVGWKDETLFAASASGFVVIDFLKDGRERLAVVTVGEGTREVHSMWLD